LIVGFPDRSKKPWNRLEIPSRIEHLQDVHDFKDTKKQLLRKYSRYFVRTIEEVEKHVERMVTGQKRARGMVRPSHTQNKPQRLQYLNEAFIIHASN